MNPLYTQFFTALVRHGLSILGAILVKQGIFTGEEMNIYTLEFAAGIVALVVGLGTEFIHTRWARWKELLKLEAPPSTPESKINADFNAGVKPMTPLMSMANEGPKPR